jgi:hypothetical protein
MISAPIFFSISMLGATEIAHRLHGEGRCRGVCCRSSVGTFPRCYIGLTAHRHFSRSSRARLLSSREFPSSGHAGTGGWTRGARPPSHEDSNLPGLVTCPVDVREVVRRHRCQTATPSCCEMPSSASIPAILPVSSILELFWFLCENGALSWATSLSRILAVII